MRIPAVSFIFALCVSVAAVLCGADNGSGKSASPIPFADSEEGSSLRLRSMKVSE